MIEQVLAILFSYLVGALPTGYLIAQWHGIKDIRKHGSGNIGATNVARVLGRSYFFLIFFLDAAKAYGTLWLVSHWVQGDVLLLCAAALLIGNAFSLFLHFTGGKNISTLFGILLFLDVMTVGWFLGAWVVALFLYRKAGIASIAGLLTLFANVLGRFLGGYVDLNFALFCLGAALLGLYLHRNNIKQIMRGRKA